MYSGSFIQSFLSAYFVPAPVLILFRELHDLDLAYPATLTTPHSHLALCTPAIRNLFPVSKCTVLPSVLLVLGDALSSEWHTLCPCSSPYLLLALFYFLEKASLPSMCRLDTVLWTSLASPIPPLS